MIGARGGLKPLLRLMRKMRFQNDFDAYATVIQFVSRRALRLGGYRPLVLYGPMGCGKTRIVHCDRCGKEITVPENSNVTEEWILFCEDCEKEVGPVVDPRP